MIQDIRHEWVECGGDKNGKCEMNWVECGGYLDLKMRWVDFEGYVDVFEPPHSFLSNSWLLVENMEHMKYNLSFLKKNYQILKILEWSVQKRGYTLQNWQGHNFLLGIANVSSQESYWLLRNTKYSLGIKGT